MTEERKKIKFIRYDKTDSKNIDTNKKLSDIRVSLKLSEGEFFIYFEDNKEVEYTLDEEINTKLKEIIKGDNVYLNKKIPIKQKNFEAFKIVLFNESLENKININSTLDELREKLPISLKNEDFLFEEGGDKVKREDEKETSISDINNNDIIYMTGARKNLKEVGKIKIDHAKKVEANMGLITNSDRNIIFFGSVGAGKTTLTNIICGTNFETSDSSPSSTGNIQFSTSLKKNDCIAIDFPGLGSVKDQLNHFKTQQTTLSIIPVRMICFVIKFDNRHDNIIQDIQEMKQIFEDYINNTIIIITHSEPILHNLKQQEDIRKIIKEMLKYNPERIIFSYKAIDYDLLFTKKLKPVMERMENIPKMIIKTKDLINQMKIIGDDLFKEERDKFQEDFNKTLSKFESKFEEFKNNDDAKRALFFALKLYKNKHIRKYSKKIRSMSTDDSLEFLDKIICEILLYSNRIHNQFMNFIQPPIPETKQGNNTQPIQEIKKFNIGIQISNQDTNDEYNKFKKCPYCGTIWFRYTGCYSVYCGKRGTKKGDQISGCFKNYYVQFSNGTITVEESQKMQYARISDYELGQILKTDSGLKPDKEHKNNLDLPVNFNLLTEEEKKENETKKTQNITLLQPVGCGNRFNWGEASDVTKEVIEELGSDLGKNFTDYYSDVLEIKRELKVRSFVSEIKNKLVILNNKNPRNNEEEEEKKKIENIIRKFEEYESLKNAERENLDEIKENSSGQKDEQSETRNKRIKLFEEIIKLLKEIDYYVLS